MSHRVLMVVLCGVIIVNALSFTAYAAIALPSSDAWFFIDTFARKALAGNLQLVDFFAQRHAGDHSQPLHRLVLLAHLWLADLDFRIEALVGVVLAILTCALLARSLFAGANTSDQRRRAWWGSASIFAVGLSLNSTMTYTWSLVGLIWISLLVAVLYWRAVSTSLPARKYVPLMSALTFLVAMVTDELAFPIFAAALAAILALDGVTTQRRASWLLLSGGIALLAARLAMDAMGGAAAAATGGSLSQLEQTLRSPDAWKIVVGPLADSLVHQQHLVAWFPRSSVAIQVLVAIVLLVLHALFWWRVFTPRDRPGGHALVLAVACMLFFYASVAGIALSRLGEFGIDYVHQPRYVVVFALNVIALLLLFFAPASDAGTPPVRRWERRLGGTFAVGVLLLQAPLSYAAWSEGPFVRQYARSAAVALAGVARDPASDAAAASCPPILRVCNAPADVRARMISLLREHGLSIFSARFRAAHGLEALDLDQGPRRSVARPASTPINCGFEILKRAPMQVPMDGTFRPNGRSAFWMTVPPATPAFHIEFEGRPVAMSRRGGVATFLYDERQAQAVRAGRPLRFAVLCSGKQVAAFEVAVR